MKASTEVQNAWHKFSILILLMINNAEIVQCKSQVKIGVKWNSSFVKMIFWVCSCSDYYLNCANVCELLFIKTVILARPGC